MDISTHSCRKYAESTSVSKIYGPSRTQVCLQGGQGVGRTQDCYMFQEADSAALVGRTVAQLHFDEVDVLPPHFGTDTLTKQEYGWDNFLPGYALYNDSFKQACPFLLAYYIGIPISYQCSSSYIAKKSSTNLPAGLY